MKRFLTILFVLAFATNVYALDFGWTISDSATNSLSNSGAFTAGVITLYLWYHCTNNLNGLASAEFNLATTNPANSVLAFTTMSGFLNAGGATNLLLAVGGCPGGPLPAGSILVLSSVPGQYCIVDSATPLNHSVNCVDLMLFPNDHIGYANDGLAPCSNVPPGAQPCIVAVENTSWGSVKSLYR